MESQKVQIRPFQDSDAASVVALWHAVLPDSAPHNDPALSLQKKLAVDRDLLFVAESEGQIAGTVMAGYDGHRGWIYSVAVLPQHRRQGIGRRLLEAAEAVLRERGCLKLNLQVRATNAEVIAFYERLGYRVEQHVSMGKRLYKESVASPTTLESETADDPGEC